MTSPTHDIAIATPVRRAALALVLILVGACSSTPQGEITLTKKQKLGAWLEYSLRYVEMGEYQRALDQARQALDLDPNNERFLILFAETNLLMRDERGNQTINAVRAADDALRRIDRDKQDWRVNAVRGEVAERFGLYYAQIADGIRKGTVPTEAKDPMARAKERNEEAARYWREATIFYERSRELRTGEPRPLRGLVRTTALLGRDEECLEHCQSVIDAVRASRQLAANQLEDEGISAQRESSLRSDQLANQNLEIDMRMLMAEILNSLDRFEDSVAELDRVLDLDPDHVDAYAPRAQLLMKLGEHVKARASITRFLEIKATTTEFNDPEIRKAFDLQEEIDRAILTKEQRG